jgi:hypothetical protein
VEWERRNNEYMEVEIEKGHGSLFLSLSVST